jgi:hypothetical protein
VAGRFAELGSLLSLLLRDTDTLVASSADSAQARALRAQVRQASDILSKIIHRRRLLTGEIRDLAAFLRLPL